jgi:hypothetical protein
MPSGAMKRAAACGTAAVAGLWLCGCSPEAGFNTMADYDVVATHYRPEKDFGALSTFALPDTIVHCADPASPLEREISREFDGLILSLVRDNLEALGYVEETDPGHSHPDVYVIVTAVTTDWRENSGPDRWDCWEWYPYWPVSWGPKWSLFYPYPADYFYRAGTVFIDMVDEEDIEVEEERILLVWTAAVNGLLERISGDAAERLTADVNQVFKQSPYLATR